MQQRTSGSSVVGASDREDAGPVPVLLHRIPEAMRLLSLSRSVIYELIRCGRLKSVTQGWRRLVPASAIVDAAARGR